MGISLFENTMVNMTWKEVEEYAKNDAVVLLPMAVIEEHGPHLSLGTDTYTAHTLCDLAKDKLSYQGQPAVLAPPFYWGINLATGGFPGSFTSRPSTVIACIFDICKSLYDFGFKRVYGVNIHGDPAHMKALMDGCKEATESIGVSAKYVIDKDKIAHLNKYVPDAQITGQEPYILKIDPETEKINYGEHGGCELHAGGGETASMLCFHPETVHLDIAKELPPSTLTPEQIDQWIVGNDSRKLTPGGYVGAPKEYQYCDALTKYNAFARRIAEGVMGDLA